MRRAFVLALALVLGCEDEPPRQSEPQLVLPRAGELNPGRLPLETPVRVEVYNLPADAIITAATASGASDCKATLEADGSITLLAATPGETTLDVTLRLTDGAVVRKTQAYTFASLASLRVVRALQRSAASESDVLLAGQAFEWCTNGYSAEGYVVPGLAITTELSTRLSLERPQFLTDSTADSFCALYRTSAPTAGVVVFRTSKLKRVVQVNVVDASRVTKLELVSLVTFGESQLDPSEPSRLDLLPVKSTFVLEGPSCIAPLGARFTIDDGRMGLLARNAFSTPTDGLLDVATNENAPYIPVREPGEVTARLGSFSVSATITAGKCY